MPVAKSFQSMTREGVPFEEGNKSYVYVINEKTGVRRKVRWYNNYEYKKMYPNEKIDKTLDPYYKPLKDVLGFSKGYVTLCLHASYEEKEWFHDRGARYNRWFGWFFPSEVEIPEEDPPEGVTYQRLNYADVFIDDDTMKPEDQVTAFVESFLYEPCDSEFVGEIGERLELYLTVDVAVPLEGFYGKSTLYSMHDDCGNIFVWITGAKQWEVGSEHHIKGTVKDHKLYKNQNQTILTRCSEVKD